MEVGIMRVFEKAFCVFIVLNAVLVTVQSVDTDSESTAEDEIILEEYVQEDPIEEYILCRGCGAPVADSYDLVDRPSPHSSFAFNETLFSRERVLVQLISSPLQHFQLVTASSAVCQGVGEWQLEEVWYPGHVWRPCVCPECGAHIGWVFEPADAPFTNSKAFFGFILGHLIGETFTDSLIATPKVKSNLVHSEL